MSVNIQKYRFLKTSSRIQCLLYLHPCPSFVMLTYEENFFEILRKTVLIILIFLICFVKLNYMRLIVSPGPIAHKNFFQIIFLELCSVEISKTLLFCSFIILKSPRELVYPQLYLFNKTNQLLDRQ